MPINRKLTAIFYADVAGYSRLTGVDEEGTHARVMGMLDMAAASIDASNGSVLRYAGDAILASFPSVVEAMRTAVKIQTALADENMDLPEDEKLHIRIGINLARDKQEEAERCVERALALNAFDGDMVLNKGLYVLFTRSAEQSMEWFDRVLDIHNETPHTVDIARMWKALSYFAMADKRRRQSQMAGNRGS